MTNNYMLGCNYWASYAGLNMWSDWRPDIIEQDFRQLLSTGVDTIRVFPLWNEFQPIVLQRGNGREWVVEDRYIEDIYNAESLMSASRIQRFDEFVRIAETCGMKMSVGLITGWMSGRMYYPPILENKLLLSDPLSVFLQVKFIEYFVNRYRNASCIVAWGPGNECNAIESFGSPEAAWMWLSIITNTIRRYDTTRPIMAGMHGLSVKKCWRIGNVADTCDYMTTHVYPIWTPHADTEVLTDMKTVLASTAQSVYYQDLSGKPCIIEEIGTLNPMLGDESIAAQYMQNVCYSSWVHGINGCFWWCAYEARFFEQPPYQWCTNERELGLFYEDRAPKKVAKAFTDFSDFLKQFPYARLPKRRIDAVCVLSSTEDMWGVAYHCFILAKQAGFDVQFAAEDQPLPDAPLYILPSVSGNEHIKDRYYQNLLKKVENGASLLVTCDDGLLNFFESIFGMVSKGRERDVNGYLLLDGKRLPIKRRYAVRMEPAGAKVLAHDEKGNPIYVKNRYGKGTVFYLDCPIETMIVDEKHLCSADGNAYYKIYELFADEVLKTRARRQHRSVGLTEHPLSETQKLLVALNYSDEPIDEQFVLPQGWRIKEVLWGEQKGNQSSVPAHDIWISLLETQ